MAPPVFIKPIFRVIPGLLYICTTIIFGYLAFFEPASYFYTMSVLTGWFLFHSGLLAIFSLIGLYRIKQTEDKKWDVMLQTMAATTTHDPYSVIHYVIVPNYSEPIEVLEETLERVSKSTLSKEQIGIVLAMEEREKGCEEKAKAIIAKYQHLFRDIFYSVHPGDIEEEQRGKGSNGNWGCRMLEKRLKEKGENLDNVILTLTDADTNYHPQFFEALTWEFLMHENRYQTLFQTPMLSYINITRVPFGNRISAIMGGINELARTSNPLDIHITYSCYSIPYKFWESMGGFDVQNISDDTRACIKGFVYSDGVSRVKTICLPTLNYIVEADGFWSSLKGKFDQAKRHAWGVSEFSCLLQDLWQRGLSRYTRSFSGVVYLFNLLFRLIEGHWSPAVALLFANVSGVLFNYYAFFGPRIHGDNWDKDRAFHVMAAAGLLMKVNAYFIIAQIGFIITTLITMYKYARNMKWWTAPYVIIEWAIFTMPVMIIFGCIPAWLSTMRFMFTDRFNFVPSQKNVFEKTTISVVEEEPSVEDEKV